MTKTQTEQEATILLPQSGTVSPCYGSNFTNEEMTTDPRIKVGSIVRIRSNFSYYSGMSGIVIFLRYKIFGVIVKVWDPIYKQYTDLACDGPELEFIN